MMSEQQPELHWAPLPPAPKRRGRVWLIAGIIVAVVVIAAVLLLFLIPRGPAPEPTASPTPTASATPTSTPTPTPTPTPTTPVVTAPPTSDPSVGVFRDQVSVWLNDAVRGLDIVANNAGPDALPVIETLQDDAQRLSDAQAPSSISESWRDGVTAYAQKLTALRDAASAGTGVAAAVDAARAAAGNLRALVGL